MAPQPDGGEIPDGRGIGALITAEDITGCNWQDIDSGQTAIGICAFLKGIGIFVAIASIAEPTLLIGTPLLAWYGMTSEAQFSEMTR